MTASDQNRQDWLDREWDALVRGDEGRINPAYADVLRGLQRDDPTPGPSPEFVQSLWGELEAGTWRSNVRSMWGGSRLALVAAAVALVLISASLLAVLVNYDSPSDDGRVVVIESSATPTPPLPSGHDTPTTGAAPTEAGQPTPPLTTSTPVSPTATSPTVTVGPGESPTVQPEATVPTGPPPQGQAGGPPAYTALSDYVNSADLIVVGRVSGPSVGDDANFIFYPFAVDEAVRGSGGSEMLIRGLTEGELTGDQFLLFLSGPYEGDSGPYYDIRLFVPLSDGAVVALEYETVEYHPRADYGGQPVDALIDAIDALPVVEDEIGALLTEYGWTPIRKGYLWPQTLPDAEALGQSGPLPRRWPTWSAALSASQRIGLDFGDLAGQEAALLPVIVERDRVDGEHLLSAEFLVVDQRVIGAWVVVMPDRFGRAYGLDEREAVLEVPVLIPTPEPMPTISTPEGDTVNPAALYRLAETETFVLCWPWCGDAPVTVTFRDAVVAVLDRDLEILPLGSHPIPEWPREPEPATGEHVVMTFGYLTPGWPTVGFVYDRAAGLLLLPMEAGWVAAPDDLVQLLAGVEPPPMPTKEP